MSDDRHERWELVGQAIRERMVKLSLSQTELVKRSGVSDMTVRPLQYGEPGNYRPVTLARVARALEWPPDAITRILNGEDPASFVEVGTSGRSYDDRIAMLPQSARNIIDAVLETAEREMADRELARPAQRRA